MKRSGLKRKTRLRRVSDKRRRAMADRVRVGIDIPASCELCPHLEDFGPRDPRELALLSQVDPHHVYGRDLDHECNVVAACRWCHAWSHRDLRYGRLFATWVLIEAGRFDRDRVWKSWGRDPIAYLESHRERFESDLQLDATWILVRESF